MENFEEKLKARSESLEAKIEKAIELAKEAVIKSEQTAQAFKEFAEELHQEKIEKLKALKKENQ